VIQLDDVSKRYPGGQEALTALSLQINTGELAFITGHSGAGKSTLLKLITLIERPTRGQVLVGGVNTGRLTARRIPAFRRRIGVVFQDNKLLHDRSVFDNVALPLIIDGASRREIGRKVRASLDQVGLLSKEKRLPIELSQGEQQRVGIARAVVARPPLLVADEPTGNLDPELSEEIMRLFLRFTDVGVTVLIASHDWRLIEAMGRRVIHLEQGRLVGTALPNG
jgi:cell division transport system ATP-binding protein